jgi:hypothetical protein
MYHVVNQDNTKSLGHAETGPRYTADVIVIAKWTVGISLTQDHVDALTHISFVGIKSPTSTAASMA